MLKDICELKINNLMIEAKPNDNIWPILNKPSNNNPNKIQNGIMSISLSLKDINFSNYITMELIPPVSDPFACVRGGKAEEFKDNYTEQSINHLKKIESQLK